jgi:hypothetical protein
MEVLMAEEAPCEELTMENLIIPQEDGLALVTSEEELGQVWIGDSGATCHMTNSEEGLINQRPVRQGIKMGNGSILLATKCGNIVMTLNQDRKQPLNLRK